jgi:prepilin-type N-terminal cleavage/methylation domain-containing protein
MIAPADTTIADTVQIVAPAPSPADDTARPRRRAAARFQRGMTLLEIMIVLAIIALVMGFLVGPQVMKAFSGSRVDVAKATMKKYAFEAFTQWSIRNPGKACPASVIELNEYMNNKDAKDPWGNDYQVLCGDQLPAGAKGIGILSLGEDGKANTEDDLKSWED